MFQTIYTVMICSVEINQSWACEKIVYVATSDYMLQRKITSVKHAKILKMFDPLQSKWTLYFATICLAFKQCQIVATIVTCAQL